MARISLYNRGQRSADYRFIDRNISEYINASGTDLFIRLYQGTYDKDGGVNPLTEIQDAVFQENRDRKYSNEIYEMRGSYLVQDNDFDLRQFGFFMGGDTLFIEVHLNDMIALLGRKIMAGDVIELPHQRDDALLDEGEAINRFYVVEESSRAADGYSVTWLPHLWRIKVSPLTDSQEFSDILDKAALDPFGLESGSSLRDLLSTVSNEMNINEEIVDEAIENVLARNFETRQFYYVPGDETGDQLPWLWSGDGVPPNGATLLGSGAAFPLDAQEGDYFLRTNYTPHQLYRKVGSAWRLQELDYRMGKWSAAHRLLESFWNNDNETVLQDGTTVKEKIALSKAIRPPSDF